MAFFRYDFKSHALEKAMSFNCVLPEFAYDGYRPMSEIPVLWLLHGMSDDATAWMRYTSIERYACDRGIIVIMPDGGRSFYCDMAAGPRYWEHIGTEVPAVARHVLGLSARRELNFVAGLSMGGYGALRHAALKPEEYFAVGTLSGAVDAVGFEGNLETSPEWRGMFGDKILGTQNDLIYQLGLRVREGKKMPRIYQYCGTEDFLYQNNRDFLAKTAGLGLDITYTEAPGDHQWRYWDEYIVKFIDWALRS